MSTNYSFQLPTVLITHDHLVATQNLEKLVKERELTQTLQRQLAQARQTIKWLKKKQKRDKLDNTNSIVVIS
jgi:hypothetical protein